VQVAGYAGLPTLSRNNAAMQFLYVNRRPVRDRLLLEVIERPIKMCWHVIVIRWSYYFWKYPRNGSM